MDKTNDVINFQGKNIQPEITSIFSEMSKEWKDDDLADLLCGCEMLLQANDTYLEKLNEHGFKKLYNLFSGIEKKCNLRFRNNSQVLQAVTLEIQKIILSRFNDLAFLMQSLHNRQQEENIFMQRCIKFLIQKVNDHKTSIVVLDIRLALIEWESYIVGQYSIYSDTKKVLRMVSDIYVITKGKCEVNPGLFDSAISKLRLSDVKISPNDFAKAIIQDSDCLPLYMKDELNYDNAQYSLSDYGGIICKAHKWIMNPDIQEILAGRSIEDLVLPPLEKLIENKNIDDVLAPTLCRQLLVDLKKMYEDTKTKQISTIDVKPGKPATAPKPITSQTLQRNYSLVVLTARYMLECSLNNCIEIPFEHKGKFKTDEDEMEAAMGEIAAFSPAIIARTNGIDIGNKNAHVISFADLWFCLWSKKRKQDRTLDSDAKYIVLVDYYNKYLRVSCYSLGDAGAIPKLKPWIDIKYNKLKKNIMEAIHSEFFPDISDGKFNMDISKGEIVLYRLFETKQYIGDKLDALEIPLIDGACGRILEALKKPDILKSTVDMLYDF